MLSLRLLRGARTALARARRACADERGVAAVEFAMILPLILLIYVAVVDLTRGVNASRKVDILSRTISDLVSQQSTTVSVPASTISLIFTAASSVMAPFPTSGLKLTVSAVDIKLTSAGVCCQALVRWSYTQGGTLRACATPLTQVPDGTPPTPGNIPVSLITANKNGGFGYTSGQTSYLVIADVSYSYVPFFQQAVGWFSNGMTRTTFLVPRSVSGPITLTSPVAAGTGQSGIICF